MSFTRKGKVSKKVEIKTTVAALAFMAVMFIFASLIA